MGENNSNSHHEELEGREEGGVEAASRRFWGGESLATKRHKRHKKGEDAGNVEC
jgi:hypothetical protein